ncbi:MAG TPA: SigE family RNA polymerase sigma factor [Mycobacteriales bacterium]|jgi:RNA polymerase sigma-70 factor (sigma-E family)|nr:SigE family RNA polymerase sigma factor [Mycobacteriales bacterium]
MNERRGGYATTSFDEFVVRALPDLLAFAHRLTADAAEAEDLVQAALVKSMARWSAIERQDDPFVYVRRVIVNTHITWWRRWSARVTVGSVPERVSAEHTQLAADQDEVRRALLALPQRQRAVLVLRFYEDMSEAQIAVALDCRPGTVKSQASRAMATLRRALDPHRIDIEEVAR